MGAQEPQQHHFFAVGVRGLLTRAEFDTEAGAHVSLIFGGVFRKYQ
jgi:hypothetical protein